MAWRERATLHGILTTDVIGIGSGSLLIIGVGEVLAAANKPSACALVFGELKVHRAAVFLINSLKFKQKIMKNKWVNMKI